MIRPSSFLRAVADLFWSFLPFFIIAFVLGLMGRLENIAERSDLTLCAGVFFAEGWWRIRKANLPDTARLTHFGMIGAMVAVLLALLALFAELGLVSVLVSFVTSRAYISAQVVILIFSIGYALFIRMRIQGRKSEDETGMHAPPSA